LRVTAQVPQALAAQGAGAPALRVDIPALGRQGITPTARQWLPTVNAAAGTMELRLDLPPDMSGAVPGQFARIQGLAVPGTARSAVQVPQSAIVRRADMTGLYVVSPEGQALLRQVRLGATQGAKVEVISGLRAGERIALDPQAASRVH